MASKKIEWNNCGNDEKRNKLNNLVKNFSLYAKQVYTKEIGDIIMPVFNGFCDDIKHEINKKYSFSVDGESFKDASYSSTCKDYLIKYYLIDKAKPVSIAVQFVKENNEVLFRVYLEVKGMKSSRLDIKVNNEFFESDDEDNMNLISDLLDNNFNLLKGDDVIRKDQIGDANLKVYYKIQKTIKCKRPDDNFFDDKYEKILNEVTTAIKDLIPIYESVINSYPANKINSILDDIFEDKNKTKQFIFTGAPGTGKTYGITSYLDKKCIRVDDTNVEKLKLKIKNKNKQVKEGSKLGGGIYEFVQFHPSFDYTDFVEGLRPARVKGDSSDASYSFVRVDGIFKAFCRNVIKIDEDKNYIHFFVIDEINRADLSKVFGELMRGLEEGYRGESHPVITQYHNMPTYEFDNEGVASTMTNDVFENGFYIPENVYIIGTMNDIDRSVESIDFAMRRRFSWINIKANDVLRSTIVSILKKDLTESGKKIQKQLENRVGAIANYVYDKGSKMNEVITSASDLGLGEAFNIGPAYYKDLFVISEEEKDKVCDFFSRDNQKLAYLNDYNDKNNRKRLICCVGDLEVVRSFLNYKMSSVWVNKIKPLLIEYCRGKDREKVSKFIDVCRDQLGVKAHDVFERNIEEYLTGSDKQIIFTGAPGTGKTHDITEFLENNCKGRFKVVQFHPSYDYSDFVEGLRPAKVFDRTTENKKDSFVRLDGIFKDYCRGIIDSGSDRIHYFFIDEINRADLSKVFGELMYCLEEGYRGPENFVKTQYSNLPTYKVELKDKEKLADIIDKDEYKTKFYIPENLYIIGAMNDIDRSVEAFDFALRRRFKWVNISANEVMERGFAGILGIDVDTLDGNEKAMISSMIELNKYLSSEEGGRRFGLDDAYHISHSYLKSYDTSQSLDSNKAEIWESRIEPILQEYCRGKKNTEVFIEMCLEIFMANGVKNN